MLGEAVQERAVQGGGGVSALPAGSDREFEQAEGSVPVQTRQLSCSMS